MADTVTRTKRVEVQRCAAKTPPKSYRPAGGRCPYQAVTILDGEPLCRVHADQWVRNEGITEQQQRDSAGMMTTY